MTKIEYPQVLQRLLTLLNLPFSVASLQEAARLLRIKEALSIKLRSGPYKGCWDNKKIRSQIANHVLKELPQLVPLISEFEEEGHHYTQLCVWLNLFLEQTAWLSGNRPWPISLFIPVKRSNDGKFESGVLISNDTGYHIYKHDGPLTPNLNKLIHSYPTALEAALDEWTID